MQNLLAGLTRGTEVRLYTPLADGLVELTRFTPPIALPRPEAEAAVAVARQQLRLLDIPAPTGVLPLTGEPPLVSTEILTAGAPPVAPPASAASGGSAPPPYPTQ